MMTTRTTDRSGPACRLARRVARGGFALVAWPAEYGVSGILTLIINHDGVVFEKDLGSATAIQARQVLRFNPDKTWRPVVLE